MNDMKPLTVARYEFVNSLTNLINNSHLPPFVIEAVLKDFYGDVKNIAQQQLESDMKNYANTKRAGDA